MASQAQVQHQVVAQVQHQVQPAARRVGIVVQLALRALRGRAAAARPAHRAATADQRLVPDLQALRAAVADRRLVRALALQDQAVADLQ